jgi:hypothetical protein
VGLGYAFLSGTSGVEGPEADAMREYLKFFIDGAWVEPVRLETLDVEDPATELVAGRIALGSATDVDRAVRAARVRSQRGLGPVARSGWKSSTGS